MTQQPHLESELSGGSRTVLERASRLAVYYELTKPGITGIPYLVGMAILGACLLGLAVATLREDRLTATAARRVFLGSLIYHPLFLLLLLVDAVRL